MMENEKFLMNETNEGNYSEKQPLLLGLKQKTEPIWRQYMAALIASLMSMATGCMGGWSSFAVPVLMDGLATELGGIRKVTSDEASWVVSLVNLGNLVGSIPAGKMSFYYGRKNFLLHLGALAIIGWLLIICNFNNVGFLCLGRFICGFVGGAVCVVLSMYSNEICCDMIRGRSGAFYDMMQVFGILYVYSVSAITTILWSTLLCTVIPIIFLFLFYWMPESPLYLFKIGKKEEAIEVIRWLHGKDCDINEELTRIKLALLEGKENDLDEDDYDSSFLDVVSIKKFYNNLSMTTIKSFILILILFVIQRSCGAPLVVYYTVDIFKLAQSSIPAEAATVYTGAAQFFFSILSISLMNCIGRRVLLLFSFGVMIITSYIFIMYLSIIASGFDLQTNYGWIPAVMLSLFIGVFRLGVGPIPWFYCTELLPTESQRWALPFIFFVAWSVAFLCSKSYLKAVEIFGFINVFIVFTIICIFGLLHTILLLPETKSKSRLQIQEELGSSASSSARINNIVVTGN